MSGKLYVLSSGLGVVDLIIVCVVWIFGQLDVLYVLVGCKGGDSLVFFIVCEYLGVYMEVCCCYFLMSVDSVEKEVVWNDVVVVLVQEVVVGRQVGFIIFGDVMLFSIWVFLLQWIGCLEWLEIVSGVIFFVVIVVWVKILLVMEQQLLVVIFCIVLEVDIVVVLCQYDSLVLMKVYGCFVCIKVLLVQVGLLDVVLMMLEVILLGEQCWCCLCEVSDDQLLFYFLIILVNKQWEEV